MKALLPTLSLLLFVACGTREDVQAVVTDTLDKEVKIDKDLLKIAEEIASWSGDTIDTTVIYRIYLSDNDLVINGNKPVVAYCRTQGIDIWAPYSRQMVFNRKVWKSLNTASKYQLMAHELGHCLHGLKDIYNPLEYSKLMYWQMRDQEYLDTLTIEAVKTSYLSEVWEYGG
jgi:hypothetical protein